MTGESGTGVATTDGEGKVPQDGRRELYDELLRLERAARDALAADPRRGPRHEDRRPPTYSRNAAAAEVERRLGRSFHESRIADWLPEEYADFKRPRDFDTFWALIQLMSQWSGQIPDLGRWNGRWTAAASRRPASRRPRNAEAITSAADGPGPLDIVVARMTAFAERLRDRHQLDRFTGRAELIKQIDEAIKGQPSGYVVVRGDAGVGKSALAAHLITTCGYPFHVSEASGGRRPETTRRNLAAQLIAGYGLDHLAPGRAFPAEADDPDWLMQVLEAAAEAHHTRGADCVGSGEGAGPLVLVVDGLDEAADAAMPEQTGIPFALPRPREMPDGVHILATSRYGLSTMWAGSGPDRYADIVVSGTENLTDLRRYLEDLVDPGTGDPKLLDWLTAAGVSAARFVDTLAARSAGVWIYLRYVLDDLRSGKRPARGLDALNGLPQGLDDYYLQQLDRWRTGPDWATLRLPALATLTALRRLVTVAELASFTGHTHPAELVALATWTREGLRAFLDHQDDGQTTRYQVLHQSLRDLIGRDNTGGPLPHDTDPLRIQVRDAHRAAHAAIARSVLPNDLEDLEAWTCVSSDVREELSEHAALGGLLPDLLTHSGFSLTCSPAGVLQRRRYAQDAASRAAIAALELRP